MPPKKKSRKEPQQSPPEDDALECSMCTTLLGIVRFDCGHAVFCSSCAKAYVDKRQPEPKCPLCKVPVKLNFFGPADGGADYENPMTKVEIDFVVHDGDYRQYGMGIDINKETLVIEVLDDDDNVAAHLGMEVGDQIVKIDATPVRSFQHVQDALCNYMKTGETTTLTVIRSVHPETIMEIADSVRVEPQHSSLLAALQPMAQRTAHDHASPKFCAASKLIEALAEYKRFSAHMDGPNF